MAMTDQEVIAGFIKAIDVLAGQVNTPPPAAAAFIGLGIALVRQKPSVVAALERMEFPAFQPEELDLFLDEIER